MWVPWKCWLSGCHGQVSTDWVVQVLAGWFMPLYFVFYGSGHLLVMIKIPATNGRTAISDPQPGCALESWRSFLKSLGVFILEIWVNWSGWVPDISIFFNSWVNLMFCQCWEPPDRAQGSLKLHTAAFPRVQVSICCGEEPRSMFTSQVAWIWL